MQKAVLVVEDEALIRFVAVDVLEDEGYVVYEAGSVLEAVGILSNHDIDLVFTDVNMPGGLTGFDLAKLLAGVHPDIPVIVTSGRYHNADDSLPAGIRFLPKPYDLGLLTSLASELMSTSDRDLVGKTKGA